MNDQISMLETPVIQPLAARLRPRTLDEVIGQSHLLGPGKVLRRIVEGDQVCSMIFWGPPGVGKTTLANVIANHTKARFINFSAVTSGIKEIRAVMQQADDNRRYGDKTIAIDIAKNGDTVRYQITNDGAPIPEYQIDLIWDTFYRADSSRNDRGSGLAKDGTGLGLAITRQILELHGARYGCTSDAKGTTVYFEL